jgi:hypothetical protein
MIAIDSEIFTMDIDHLLNVTYKPEYPELMAKYHIDIEYQSPDGLVWGGKLWTEDDCGNEHPFLAVDNAGEGGCNKYIRITSPERRDQFFKDCEKAFPTHTDFADVACLYLELRQAKQDLDREEQMG